MKPLSWTRYFSEHYPKFQGALPACIGLFLIVEIVGRNPIYPVFGAAGPWAELINFGVCMGLYVAASWRYWKKSTWSGDASRKGFMLRVVWGSILTCLLTVYLTPYGAEKPIMVSGLVAAAWLLLYRSQLGGIWEHYLALIPYLLIISGASLLSAGLYPGSSLDVLLLSYAGVILVACGTVDFRIFESAISNRLGKT